MKRSLVAIMLALMISAMAGCDKQTENSIVQQSDTTPAVQLSSEPELPTQLYARPDSCKIKIDEKKMLSISSDKGSIPVNELDFVCDDDSIVIVDSSGNIFGRAPGNCVVTASLRNKPSAYVKINVTVKSDEESSTVKQSSQPSTPEPSKEPSVAQSPSYIVITPYNDNNASISLPKQYTYYYNKDNFSYGRLSAGYVAYAMTERWLTNYDISNITNNDAQMLINTIYAKNGYHFNASNLRDFFNSMTWYTDLGYDSNSVKSRFDSVDKHNIELLVNVRDS